MRTLHRSLINEMVPLFVVGLVTLLLLLLLTFLVEILGDAMARGVPFTLLAKYLVCKLPFALGPGLPLALLFASLLTMTRLTQDSELKAALALGLRPATFVWPLLVVGLTVSVLTFISNELVVPKSEQRAREVEQEILMLTPEVLLKDGAFFSDALGRTVYLGSAQSGGELNDIVVIDAANGVEPREVLTAQTGRVSADSNHWHLGSVLFNVFKNSRLVMAFQADTAEFPVRGLATAGPRAQDLFTVPMHELRTRLAAASSVQRPSLLTAFYRKITEPLAALAFTFFAAAIGLFSFRHNVQLGLVSVLFLTFMYYATWSIAKLLGAQGALPALVAAVLPLGLYAGAGALLFMLAVRR